MNEKRKSIFLGFSQCLHTVFGTLLIFALFIIIASQGIIIPTLYKEIETMS